MATQCDSILFILAAVSLSQVSGEFNGSWLLSYASATDQFVSLRARFDGPSRVTTHDTLAIAVRQLAHTTFKALLPVCLQLVQDSLVVAEAHYQS